MSTKLKTPLSPEAEQAWHAYQAMGQTKLGYFGFLQELDQKYPKNESPSIAENLKLEQLLSAHDIKVKAFNEAMTNVKDASARQVLLNKLTNDSVSPGTH
ncbi:MAG: hypothetical protein ACI9SC_001758 [Gammaproteobacteria bacterium]|jgi:hypothetical protein